MVVITFPLVCNNVNSNNELHKWSVNIQTPGSFTQLREACMQHAKSFADTLCRKRKKGRPPQLKKSL